MSSAGQPRQLAHYTVPTGPRLLIGQRINGRVAITDLPTAEDGRVYLVERHVESQAAIRALVADYIAESQRRGEPAARVPRELGA